MLSNEERWKDVNHLINRPNDNIGELLNNQSQVHYSNFLKENGLTKDDLLINSDIAFILTPFHPDMDSTYQAIVSACAKLGLRSVRADEQFTHGEIFPQIIKQIAKARIIIANWEKSKCFL
ncbi:hypothetical protein YSY22_12980 [Brevibacillus formosus]